MPDPFDLVRSAASVEQVLSLCKRKGRVLLLLQNNPDPDGIASALALRNLIHDRINKRAVIGYGGICGRAENRAMLQLLRIEAHRITPEELGRFGTLCLLDTQPQSGNNALYATRPADIVIDHHLRPRRATWQAQFVDLRPEYGATATILYEYLLCAQILVDTNLATALTYGILSDTQDLGREVSPADTAAFLALFPTADKKKLARMRHASVPPEYFRMLHDSLNDCVVAGSAVITQIRGGTSPDMIAEVAELMLRLRGARTSVCYGVCGNTIHLSARATDARGNAYRGMKRVVSRLGTGGGHLTMAGGQIPLDEDPEKRLAQVRTRILKVFAHGKESKPLLRLEEATDDH
ncbi:MAG: DHH family phosphoesterase [Candidatus Hydrogenedentes bacterium]|nr:DHH family phosphoesterase [Candidatus Hydrogenedentota bacterium]